MNDIYKRYADSRGHNSSSVVALYLTTEYQSKLDNYIQQKEQIRESYQREKVMKEQIEDVVAQISDAINDAIG